MVSLDDAYHLVMSLYDSGDLSHDQASPVLEAIDGARGLADEVARLTERLEIALSLARVNEAKAPALESLWQDAERREALARAESWAAREVIAAAKNSVAGPGAITYSALVDALDAYDTARKEAERARVIVGVDPGLGDSATVIHVAKRSKGDDPIR
jgi:hypothetical protein